METRWMLRCRQTRCEGCGIVAEWVWYGQIGENRGAVLCRDCQIEVAAREFERELSGVHTHAA